jgi:hypothetical protein
MSIYLRRVFNIPQNLGVGAPKASLSDAATPSGSDLAIIINSDDAMKFDI